MKMEKEYSKENNKKLPDEIREQQFGQIAAKVRKRRAWTAAILIAATCFSTVSVLNYKEAGIRIKPPIVIAATGQGFHSLAGGKSSVTVYYSLGFKQVVYESQYGSNYSQRLWLWEKTPKEGAALTPEQYLQLMKQMKKRYQTEPAYAEYFNIFQTFEASILAVEKKENRYRIYLAGGLYDFLEYEDWIYTNIDGEPEQEALKEWNWKPYIITAIWKDGKWNLKSVASYERGDVGSSRIFDSFPKPLAMTLLANTEGTMKQQDSALARAKLAAAAYYGKNFAQDTCLQFDPKTETLSLYKLGTEPPEEGETAEENSTLIKRETLEKSGVKE